MFPRRIKESTILAKGSGFIERILRDYEQITSIESILDNFVHFELYGSKYALIFFNEDEFPIICAIDKKDNYPHIALKEVTIVDKAYRSLCLFEEGSLIEYIHSDEEKIRTCIERLITLCSLSSQEVISEYHKEFLVYWERACTEKNKYSGSRFQLYLKSTNEHLWLEQKRYPHQKIRIAQADYFFNDIRNQECVDKTPVLYLPIIDAKRIVPPLPGKPWGAEEINNIICGLEYQHISADAYQEIVKTSYSHKEIILVFKLNAFFFACAVEFKHSGIAKLNVKIESQIQKVTPIVIKRCDYEYLNEQIGNSTSDKRVIVVGAGSLGSYVATELVHAGFRKITLIDDDVYEYENTFRHAIRYFSTGISKVGLLKHELEYIHPEIEIIAVKERLSLDNLDKLNICSADMIIFTVGNSDIQLKLNKRFVEKKISIPIYYAWLEHDGETCHIAVVKDYKQGCFECLFSDENGNHIANSVNIATDKPIQYIRNGCGGTRAPYGNKTLLTASATLIAALQDKSDRNQIFSFVNNQIQIVDFPKKERCKCCGVQTQMHKI